MLFNKYKNQTGGSVVMTFSIISFLIIIIITFILINGVYLKNELTNKDKPGTLMGIINGIKNNTNLLESKKDVIKFNLRKLSEESFNLENEMITASKIKDNNDREKLLNKLNGDKDILMKKINYSDNLYKLIEAQIRKNRDFYERIDIKDSDTYNHISDKQAFDILNLTIRILEEENDYKHINKIETENANVLDESIKDKIDDIDKNTVETELTLEMLDPNNVSVSAIRGGQCANLTGVKELGVYDNTDDAGKDVLLNCPTEFFMYNVNTKKVSCCANGNKPDTIDPNYNFLKVKSTNCYDFIEKEYDCIHKNKFTKKNVNNINKCKLLCRENDDCKAISFSSGVCKLFSVCEKGDIKKTNSGYFEKKKADCRDYKYCSFINNNKNLCKELNNSFINDDSKCLEGDILKTFSTEKKYELSNTISGYCDKYYKYNSTTDVNTCMELCKNEPNCNKFSISSTHDCRYSSCSDNMDLNIPCPEDKQCIIKNDPEGQVYINKVDQTKDILNEAQNECLNNKECNGINKNKNIESYDILNGTLINSDSCEFSLSKANIDNCPGDFKKKCDNNINWLYYEYENRIPDIKNISESRISDITGISIENAKKKCNQFDKLCSGFIYNKKYKRASFVLNKLNNKNFMHDGGVLNDYEEISSGIPAKKNTSSYVSKEACELYAKSKGATGLTGISTYGESPSGCLKQNNKYYFATNNNNIPCTPERKCIQNNNLITFEKMVGKTKVDSCLKNPQICDLAIRNKKYSYYKDMGNDNYLNCGYSKDGLPLCTNFEFAKSCSYIDENKKFKCEKIVNRNIKEGERLCKKNGNSSIINECPKTYSLFKKDGFISKSKLFNLGSGYSMTKNLCSITAKNSKNCDTEYFLFENYNKKKIIDSNLLNKNNITTNGNLKNSKYLIENIFNNIDDVWFTNKEIHIKYEFDDRTLISGMVITGPKDNLSHAPNKVSIYSSEDNKKWKLIKIIENRNTKLFNKPSEKYNINFEPRKLLYLKINLFSKETIKFGKIDFIESTRGNNTCKCYTELGDDINDIVNDYNWSTYKQNKIYPSLVYNDSILGDGENTISDCSQLKDISKEYYELCQRGLYPTGGQIEDWSKNKKSFGENVIGLPFDTLKDAKLACLNDKNCDRIIYRNDGKFNLSSTNVKESFTNTDVNTLNDGISLGSDEGNRLFSVKDITNNILDYHDDKRNKDIEEKDINLGHLTLNSDFDNYFSKSGSSDPDISKEKCLILGKKNPGGEMLERNPGSGHPNGCVFHDDKYWWYSSNDSNCTDDHSCVKSYKKEDIFKSSGNVQLKTTNASFIYNFKKNVFLRGCVIKGPDSDDLLKYSPTSITISGSFDNENWSQLALLEIPSNTDKLIFTSENEEKEILFSKNTYLSYIKLEIKSNLSVMIQQIKFLEVDTEHFPSNEYYIDCNKEIPDNEIIFAKKQRKSCNNIDELLDIKKECNDAKECIGINRNYDIIEKKYMCKFINGYKSYELNNENTKFLIPRQFIDSEEGPTINYGDSSLISNNKVPRKYNSCTLIKNKFFIDDRYNTPDYKSPPNNKLKNYLNKFNNKLDKYEKYFHNIKPPPPKRNDYTLLSNKFNNDSLMNVRKPSIFYKNYILTGGEGFQQQSGSFTVDSCALIAQNYNSKFFSIKNNGTYCQIGNEKTAGVHNKDYNLYSIINFNNFDKAKEYCDNDDRCGGINHNKSSNEYFILNKSIKNDDTELVDNNSWDLYLKNNNLSTTVYLDNYVGKKNDNSIGFCDNNKICNDVRDNYYIYEGNKYCNTLFIHNIFKSDDSSYKRINKFKIPDGHSPLRGIKGVVYNNCSENKCNNQISKEGDSCWGKCKSSKLIYIDKNGNEQLSNYIINDAVNTNTINDIKVACGDCSVKKDISFRLSSNFSTVGVKDALKNKNNGIGFISPGSLFTFNDDSCKGTVYDVKLNEYPCCVGNDCSYNSTTTSRINANTKEQCTAASGTWHQENVLSDSNNYDKLNIKVLATGEGCNNLKKFKIGHYRTNVLKTIAEGNVDLTSYKVSDYLSDNINTFNSREYKCNNNKNLDKLFKYHNNTNINTNSNKILKLNQQQIKKSTNNSSWTNNELLCALKGKRLCYDIDICPNNTINQTLLVEDKDAWRSITDQNNLKNPIKKWIYVGNKNYQPCKIYNGEPKWSERTNNYDFRDQTICCPITDEVEEKYRQNLILKNSYFNNWDYENKWWDGETILHSNNLNIRSCMNDCMNDPNCLGIGRETNNSRCYKLYNGKPSADTSTWNKNQHIYTIPKEINNQNFEGRYILIQSPKNISFSEIKVFDSENNNIALNKNTLKIPNIPSLKPSWKEFINFLMKNEPNLIKEDGTERINIDVNSIVANILPRYSGGDWDKLFQDKGGHWDVQGSGYHVLYTYERSYNLPKFPWREFYKTILDKFPGSNSVNDIVENFSDYIKTKKGEFILDLGSKKNISKIIINNPEGNNNKLDEANIILLDENKNPIWKKKLFNNKVIEYELNYDRNIKNSFPIKLKNDFSKEIKKKPRRNCQIYDNWRKGFTTGSEIPISSNLNYGSSTTWDECLSYCEKNKDCKQAVFQKSAKSCYTMNAAKDNDDNNSGGSSTDWISTQCNNKEYYDEYSEEVSGKADTTVSREECKKLSENSFGSWLTGNIFDSSDYPSGCVKQYSSTNNRYIYYYNTAKSNVDCGKKDSANYPTKCIKKERIYYMKNIKNDGIDIEEYNGVVYINGYIQQNYINKNGLNILFILPDKFRPKKIRVFYIKYNDNNGYFEGTEMLTKLFIYPNGQVIIHNKKFLNNNNNIKINISYPINLKNKLELSDNITELDDKYESPSWIQIGGIVYLSGCININNTLPINNNEIILTKLPVELIPVDFGELVFPIITSGNNIGILHLKKNGNLVYKLNSIIYYTKGNELCTNCKLELGELISEGYTVNKCHNVAGQRGYKYYSHNKNYNTCLVSNSNKHVTASDFSYTAEVKIDKNHDQIPNIIYLDGIVYSINKGIRLNIKDSVNMDNEEIRYIKPNISVEDRTVVIQGTIKINKIPDKNYELISVPSSDDLKCDNPIKSAEKCKNISDSLGYNLNVVSSTNDTIPHGCFISGDPNTTVESPDHVLYFNKSIAGATKPQSLNRRYICKKSTKLPIKIILFKLPKNLLPMDKTLSLPYICDNKYISSINFNNTTSNFEFELVISPDSDISLYNEQFSFSFTYLLNKTVEETKKISTSFFNAIQEGDCFDNYTNPFNDDRNPSLEECADKCLDNPNCLRFSFGKYKKDGTKGFGCRISDNNKCSTTIDEYTQKNYPLTWNIDEYGYNFNGGTIYDKKNNNITYTSDKNLNYISCNKDKSDDRDLPVDKGILESDIEINYKEIKNGICVDNYKEYDTKDTDICKNLCNNEKNCDRFSISPFYKCRYSTNKMCKIDESKIGAIYEKKNNYISITNKYPNKTIKSKLLIYSISNLKKNTVLNKCAYFDNNINEFQIDVDITLPEATPTVNEHLFHIGGHHENSNSGFYGGINKDKEIIFGYSTALKKYSKKVDLGKRYLLSFCYNKKLKKIKIMVNQKNEESNSLDIDTLITNRSKFIEVKTGNPDGSLSEKKCYQAASEMGITDASAWDWEGWPLGCSKTDDSQLRWNEKGSKACTSEYPCIQKNNYFITIGSGSHINNDNNFNGYIHSLKIYDNEGISNNVYKTIYSHDEQLCGDTTIGGYATYMGNVCDSNKILWTKIITNDNSKPNLSRKNNFFKEVAIGMPDLSVSEAECEAYGKSVNKWNSAGSWDADPSGCFIQQLDDNQIYYNRKTTSVTCADRDHCIQKNNEDIINKYFGNCGIRPKNEDGKNLPSKLNNDYGITNNYIKPFVNNIKNSNYYMKEFENNPTPNMCAKLIYDNFNTSNKVFSYVSNNKIKLKDNGKNFNSLSKDECKNYANNTEGIEWDVDSFTNDERPKGCFKHTDNKIYYNEDNNNKNIDCSDTYKCISNEPEIHCNYLTKSIENINESDVTDNNIEKNKYYLKTQSKLCNHESDIIEKSECEIAAKNLGISYTGTDMSDNERDWAQKGCFKDGDNLYWFNNKYTNEKRGNYNGRTYICKNNPLKNGIYAINDNSRDNVEECSKRCTGYKYFGIQATKPSPFYKKIAIDNDCSRTEELPGTFDSLLSCANKANEVNKGKYFIYNNSTKKCKISPFKECESNPYNSNRKNKGYFKSENNNIYKLITPSEKCYCGNDYGKHGLSDSCNKYNTEDTNFSENINKVYKNNYNGPELIDTPVDIKRRLIQVENNSSNERVCYNTNYKESYDENSTSQIIQVNKNQTFNTVSTGFDINRDEILKKPISDNDGMNSFISDCIKTKYDIDTTISTDADFAKPVPEGRECPPAYSLTEEECKKFADTNPEYTWRNVGKNEKIVPGKCYYYSGEVDNKGKNKWVMYNEYSGIDTVNSSGDGHGNDTQLCKTKLSDKLRYFILEPSSGKNCKDYSDRSNDLQNRKCKSWAIANQKEWKGVVDNSSLDTGCVLLDNDEVYYNTNQNTNNNNKSICDERTVVSRETGITYACNGIKRSFLCIGDDYEPLDKNDDYDCCIDSPLVEYIGYAYGGNADEQMNKSDTTLSEAIKFLIENEEYKGMHFSIDSPAYYYNKTEPIIGSSVNESENFTLYTKENQCSISNDNCKKKCPPLNNQCKVYL